MTSRTMQGSRGSHKYHHRIEQFNVWLCKAVGRLVGLAVQALLASPCIAMLCADIFSDAAIGHSDMASL
jgi:hypothetical protein